MSWKGGLYRALHQSVPRGTDRNERDLSAERSCGSKVRHPDWASAEAHALGIIEFNIEHQRAHKSGRLGVYRCLHCGGWHVGHGRGPEAA